MKSIKIAVVLLAMVLGWKIGSSTGFAYGGDAVNGQLLIAVLFGVVALLGCIALRTLQAATETDQDGEPTAEATAARVFENVRLFLLRCWNLEVELIERIGAMDYFCRQPIGLVLLHIGLLVLAPPLGFFLCAAGIAGMAAGSSSATRFRAAIN